MIRGPLASPPCAAMCQDDGLAILIDHRTRVDTRPGGLETRQQHEASPWVATKVSITGIIYS